MRAKILVMVRGTYPQGNWNYPTIVSTTIMPRWKFEEIKNHITERALTEKMLDVYIGEDVELDLTSIKFVDLKSTKFVGDDDDKSYDSEDFIVKISNSKDKIDAYRLLYNDTTFASSMDILGMIDDAIVGDDIDADLV